MANIFNKIITKLRETKYRYLFSRSNVRFSSDSTADISHDARIANSTVVVSNGKVTIGKNCKLVNVSIYIKNGELTLGEGTIVKDCFIEINDGRVIIGSDTNILCRHLWVRFGGTLKIGSHTLINKGTEVRADEYVEIGDYTGISYNVNIWDTNTHNFLTPEERINHSWLALEKNRPPTKPIKIGNYCWIGVYSSIMKGSKLGNNVVVGYHTMLLGQKIEDNKTVVQDIGIRIL